VTDLGTILVLTDKIAVSGMPILGSSKGTKMKPNPAEHITYKIDHAVTERLGLQRWYWATEADLADEVIDSGTVICRIPYLWGWLKEPTEDQNMTPVKDYSAIIKAATVGEAVAKFEQDVIVHLALQGAVERERWIEEIIPSEDGKAMLLVWGSPSSAA